MKTKARKKKPNNREVTIKYHVDLSDLRKKMKIVRKEIRLLKKELRGIKVQ